MNRTAFGLAGLIAIGAPAWGDVPGFFGDLVSGKSAAADFVGTWVVPGTASGAADIDHVVVTASGSGPVRIQVFGRCESRVCNWGALPARLRSDSPASQLVRSLSADFNLGFALRHITLHRSAGNLLRFDMVTEFTDGSDRHDYETAGELAPMGAQAAAVPAPAPGAAAAPAPTANAAPAPGADRNARAGSGISALNPLSWFSSKPAAAPGDNSMPVAASAAAPVDDCSAIDTGHVYLTNAGGTWRVRDFLHVVQSFGPYQKAAARGMEVIAFYRFDEVCHIGRGSTNMAFFRTAGEIPHQPMGGEDCSNVHPDAVAAVKRDDDWKVVDGSREIYDYGSDQDGATQAAAVIKSLALSRQCYFDRADLAASYWLSR